MNICFTGRRALVNNAGISIPQSFLETTVDAFDKTMAVNVRAAMIARDISGPADASLHDL